MTPTMFQKMLEPFSCRNGSSDVAHHSFPPRLHSWTVSEVKLQARSLGVFWSACPTRAVL